MSRAVLGVSCALDRIDLHDQYVGGFGLVEQRKQRRIAHVAAVPIGHAGDLDRLKQERQAGRGHHMIDGQLGRLEHRDAAGVDVGRARRTASASSQARTFSKSIDFDEHGRAAD